MPAANLTLRSPFIVLAVSAMMQGRRRGPAENDQAVYSESIANPPSVHGLAAKPRHHDTEVNTSIIKNHNRWTPNL